MPDMQVLKLLLDHGLSALILVGGWILLRQLVTAFRRDLKEQREDFKSALSDLTKAHETAVNRIIDKLSGELQAIGNGIRALRKERGDLSGEVRTRKTTLSGA